MASAIDELHRKEILRRREALEPVLHSPAAPSAERLRRQVDAALDRFEHGTYGICQACHGNVEAERLLADPLVSVCLECLSADDRQKLQADLALARSIQASLLPRRDLELEGWCVDYRYVPAGPVSGDYVDLIRPPDGGAATVLFGDVSGKGVAASLLMGALHAIFRSLASLELEPAEIIRRANRVFCDSTPSASYATLLLARTMRGGRVELFNAGHPPPLLRRAGAVTTLPLGGVAFGMFCGAEYEPTAVELAPGDALLFFTDGLPDAEDDAGDFFGVERLAHAFARTHGHDASGATLFVLNEVARHSRDVARADDMTVMVVERSGK